MLEHFERNYSPWEGPTLEKVMEDCLLCERPNTGAGKECEGARQKMNTVIIVYIRVLESLRRGCKEFREHELVGNASQMPLCCYQGK